ncbi:multiheme c-type cytochrome [Algibacter pacificus]|uniref:multiheme c-type cytochrome n=1 Tax=Algibacter pacificus TaxID=2599389 RepID=UPI001FE8BC48|nr:tetratricopeptide repeat protein [Algibacter pacificus]
MKSTYTTVLILLVLFGLFSCKEKESKYVEASSETKNVFASTAQIPDDHFLGDQTCKECHADQFKDWQGSDHDKAMQEVSDSTILADFNNVKFTSQGVTSHFYKKGGDFYVNTEGPEGTYQDYKIVYTFGIKPLQQYIVQFPNGHYQCLRTAWDTVKGKWFDLYPDFKVVHSEWLHWSRGGLNWNTMCSDCHSTNVRKNYDYKTDSYDTKYAIINVNCEACHGPGKTHVEQAKLEGEDYTFSGDLKMTVGTDSQDLVDQCARCHMRREQVSEYFNFEGTMLDHYFPELINLNTYHPDGQILDEDYVYGSFVQSKMYHNGVTCINCHDSHSYKLKFEGNLLCAQCHVPDTYDTPAHHFHEKDTEGAQCINCHMTGKYYMGNDFRRDHSFRIPRPDLSIKYATPNACIQCHKDKDNEWAWENFKKQYGKPDYKHFSDLLAPGLLGHANGVNDLMELAKDSVYPDIARASAVSGLRNYFDADAVDNLIRFLDDDSPLVRAATLDVVSSMNSSDYVNDLLPLLNDEKRAVRVRAYFALGYLDEIQIPKHYKVVYEKVKKEFETQLEVTSDFVGGRVKKGDYYLNKGNLKAAIKCYESALEIDNINNMVRTNLANLYYRDGDFEKSEIAYKKIIALEPDYAPTYYSYGLLLAELNRINEAIEQLNLAIKKGPEHIRFYYNLSLLYDKVDNAKQAETIAVKGLKLDPNNESLLYVLAYIYNKGSQINKARNIVARLVQLFPNNVEYANFYKQLNLSN